MLTRLTSNISTCFIDSVYFCCNRRHTVRYNNRPFGYHDNQKALGVCMRVELVLPELLKKKKKRNLINLEHQMTILSISL